MSLSNLVPRRYISLNSVLFRYATVAKDGSRNEEKEMSDKRQAWTRVQFAGNEQASGKRRFYQSNEYFISDPELARDTAVELFNRMAQSMKDQGYSREMKPYTPREDVIECIKSIYMPYFTPQTEKDDEWLSQPLDDMYIKFSFLNECDKQLQHEIPSPDLHLMKTVNDVVEFYRTPVRGLTTYDDLARRQNDLPPNLNVINHYIRFNPETDTFFNGKDAFPKSPLVVTGIRGRQKYEDIKVPFEWPDV